jgi:hypothetical protein
MTTALFASISVRQPLAWLQQAFKPAPKRSVRAISQEVRELRKGETLVVDHAGGQGVVCLEGALWITHDPSAEGQSAGGGRMRVRALDNTRLCLPSPLVL